MNLNELNSIEEQRAAAENAAARYRYVARSLESLRKAGNLPEKPALESATFGYDSIAEQAAAAVQAALHAAWPSILRIAEMHMLAKALEQSTALQLHTAELGAFFGAAITVTNPPPQE